jgi:hypothetical protein
METRAKRLIPIGLAILSTLLLAGALSVLELRGGRLNLPGVVQPGQGEPGGFTSLALGELFYRCLMGLLGFAVLMLPVYVLYLLRSRQGRQRLLVEAVAIGVLLFFVGLLYQGVQSVEEEELGEDPVGVMEWGGSLPPEGEAGEEEAAPLPALPDWATWGAATGLAVLVTLGAAFLLERRRTRAVPTDLDRLAGEAQQALDALQSGEDVRDVILRCYQAMSQVLEEERRIYRQSAMTPREFERLLLEKGLPAAPVQRLTHLFEEVRYGSRTPARREEDLARLSLSEIIQHCRGGAA